MKIKRLCYSYSGSHSDDPALRFLFNIKKKQIKPDISKLLLNKDSSAGEGLTRVINSPNLDLVLREVWRSEPGNQVNQPSSKKRGLKSQREGDHRRQHAAHPG